MISGYLVVNVFFALSGFVIALSYSDMLAAGPGFGKFVAAHAIRFFALYVLGIALDGLARWSRCLSGRCGMSSRACILQP